VPSRPVSIVVPLTLDLGLLWRTLDSLVRTTPEELFEVVVVACGPNAAAEEFLAGLEGDVTVVREAAGTAVGAARNAGAAKAGGQFLAFLEPGTQLTLFWLEALVRAMADPAVGVAVPRVDWPDGSRRSADGLLAAAMLVRREAFDRVGGFPDDIEGVAVERGLLDRVRAAGLAVVVDGTSLVSNEELVERAGALPEDAPELAGGSEVRPLAELRGRHEGQDVWVIASGPSMTWVEPSFFANKVTVGVNEVWRKYRTDWLVRKEHRDVQPALDSGIPLVVSRMDCGNQPPAIRATGRWWEFDHPLNRVEQPPDLAPIGSADRLLVSWSTITTAIHFAAYLGAANIMVCGHDCGFIDGMTNYAGYYDHVAPVAAGERADRDPRYAAYTRIVTALERQTMLVRDRIREVYGCSVHGLNPFVSLALEGHVHHAIEEATI